MSCIFKPGDIVAINNNTLDSFGNEYLWAKIYRQLGNLTVESISPFTGKVHLVKVYMAERHRNLILNNLPKELLPEDITLIADCFLKLIIKQRSNFSIFYDNQI